MCVYSLEGRLDEARIRQFIQEDYPHVVAAIALACGSPAAAEDAVQEALARAWERGERGELIRSPRPWITRVALNLLRSNLRRMLAERRAHDWLAPLLLRDPVETSPHQSVDIRRALAALPRRQREATVLRYYLGMDVAQVAWALRMSEGSVKTTLHRAGRTLALLLEESKSEEDEIVRH